MSVTAKDHRRFVDGKVNEERPVVPIALLPQSQSEVPSTGDARLDKIVRVIEANLEMAKQHQIEVAHAACVALKEEAKQQMALEYMFTKGMIAAYQAIQLLPARIIQEETPQHSA